MDSHIRITYVQKINIGHLPNLFIFYCAGLHRQQDKKKMQKKKKGGEELKELPKYEKI